MLFKLKELIGYCIKGEDICIDCLNKEDGAIEGIPLLEEFVDPGEVLTCDRCDKIIISNTSNLSFLKNVDSSGSKKK